MNFIINKWKGRLGNNINQIINALFYCIYTNKNLIIPLHNFFKKNIIILNKLSKVKKDDINYYDKKNFINFDKINLIPDYKIKK